MMSIKQWVDSISHFGFDLKFDCEINIYEDSGFIPMLYKDESCGFEYDFEELEDTLFSVVENPEIKGKDIMVSFSSSYELNDLSSAMIASAVLVKKCEGVYWIMDKFELNSNPIDMARELEENGLD